MEHGTFRRLALAATLAALAAGCGSDDANTGQMKLAVTDAPVDGATAVVVKFTGVELTGSGDPVTITFAAPKSIDLINDSGTATAVLFDEPIPEGSYGQIRLVVVADGDPANSYIDLSDGSRHGLDVPSGDQTGLKLVSGFDVPEGGVVAYTIDFDLRKAIVCPPGQAPVCTLKPALRLVRDDTVGNIAGVVDPLLIPDETCKPGVYLYSGADTVADDMGSHLDPATASEPLSSTTPVQTESGLRYQFTFLVPGSYTVAFTCEADVDDPEVDDDLTFDPVENGIAVTAGQTTTVDLAPAAP